MQKIMSRALQATFEGFAEKAVKRRWCRRRSPRAQRSDYQMVPNVPTMYTTHMPSAFLSISDFDDQIYLEKAN